MAEFQRPPPSGRVDALFTVAPIAEFVDEPRMGRVPVELGACPRRVGALVEQEHFGEVVAQARPRLGVGPGHGSRPAGRDRRRPAPRPPPPPPPPPRPGRAGRGAVPPRRRQGGPPAPSRAPPRGGSPPPG